MNQKWVFPSNGGGSFQGFNDGAIDQFKHDRIGSFVREAIQNSLDASDGSGSPVKVAFTMHTLESDRCPELAQLVPFLKNAENMAKDPKHKNVFREAAEELKSKKSVRFLGVHDSNTTGLTGSLTKPDGPWFSLTKGTGASIKQGTDSLGSFGHGSKAPFALTKARTVFYYSQVAPVEDDPESEYRFQGKSILQSLDRGDGTYSQGTGFFGKTDDCLPLVGDEIPDWAKSFRSDLGFGVGTSVLVPVPYWHVEEGGRYDFWQQVIVCVLASFYYAIKRGYLEVQCNTDVIDSSNVGVMFETHVANLDDDADLNVNGIKEKLKSVQTVHLPDESGVFQSETFGDIDYFLRFNSEVQWKKVGIARRNGMLITREAHLLKSFNKVRQFDLFICVSNDPGSTVLKELENPTHDSFSYDRIDDPTLQKSLKLKYESFVKELKSFIESKVPLVINAEMEIDDLDDLFASTAPDGDSNQKSDEASRRIKLSDEKVLTNNAKKPKKGDTSTGLGRGQVGPGPGKRKSTGGSIPDTRGESIITAGWKNAREAQDIRILRQKKDLPGKVSIFITAPGPEKYALELLKSGDKDAVLIALKASPQGGNRHQVTFEGREAGERIRLEFDLDVPEIDFAVEGVLHELP